MTTLTKELNDLIERIGRTAEDERHRYQPELCRQIDAMQQAGLPVGPRVLQLREDLLNAAIEAQFDNMPV